VSKIEELRPDVVFTDVATTHIPIDFLTASLRREQIEECFSHGAPGHLGKPSSMPELRIAQFANS
jgi:CheY-like chemotaxis protein